MSKKSVIEFEHKAIESAEEVVKYLQAISEGLKNGRIILGNESDAMTLEPTGTIKFQLKVKKKEGGKKKISLDIGWLEGGAGPRARPGTLVIGKD